MKEKIKWDLPTRILHWSIALSLIGLALTALLGEAVEEVYGKSAEISVFYIHLYLGFFAITVVSLRIVWGFFGNDAVNWRGLASGMASYPAAVKAELAFLLSGRPTEGRVKSAHNPLATPVYFGALALFTLTAATGLSLWSHLDQKAAQSQVNGSAIGSPAFAQGASLSSFSDGDDDERSYGEERHGGGGKSEFAEEVHEFALFWLSLYLIAHLGGVFIHYVREDKNVIRGMLNP